MKTGSEVKIDRENTWKINKKLTCDTFNCVYLIECEKCGNKYIGEKGRIIRNCLSEHRGYVNNQLVSVSTGEHFNLPGHSLANMKITIIEPVKKNDIMYIKEREIYFTKQGWKSVLWPL